MFNKQILIVEDEMITANIIRAMLIKFGHATPAIVSNGKDAIKHAEEFHPDLILMDIMLEYDMDGIETASYILENFNIPVIFVTASNDIKTMQRAKQATPYGYLFKPVEEKELYVQIELALHKYEVEEKLAENEKKLRTIFEGASDGILAADIDTKKFIFANSRMCNITAYLLEELLLLDISKLHSEKDLSYVIEQFTKQAEGKITFAKDIPVLRKDGKIIYCDVNASLLEINGRNCLVGFFRDISKRREMERNLRDSENKFRAISDAAQDAIIMMDNLGNVCYWNKSAELILGYKEEEIMGKNLYKALAPLRYHKAYQAGFNKFRNTGKGAVVGKTIELHVLKKDRTEFPIELSMSSVKIINNWYAIGIIRDITERKQIEEDLRFSKESFHNIVDRSADGILIIDQQGIVRFVNPAAETIFGVKAEKFVGSMFGCPVTKDYINEIDIFRLGGVPGVGELRVDETQWEGKSAYLLSIHDITEHKTIEGTLKKLNSDLNKSNKDLEDFTYAVSHDLKEPLRKISSFGEFLIEDSADKLDKISISYIRRMQNATERMKKLINDLLEISRVGTKGGKFANVDTNTVIADVLNLLQYTKTENNTNDMQMYIDIEGNKIIVEKLPNVFADSIQLHQVFQNLIGNGLKYHKQNELAQVTISAESNSNQVTFAVQDNGIGIEERFFDKIFLIFQRLHTREKYSGTGVGLTLCKKIVERHGGRIWCESEIGKGSSFYFTLSKKMLLKQNL